MESLGPSFVSGHSNLHAFAFLSFLSVKNGIEFVKDVIYDFFAVVGSHVAFDAKFAAYSV